MDLIVLGTLLTIAGLYLAYQRLRHSQATARVAELRVYVKPDPASAYADAIRWLKRRKLGYWKWGRHLIAMSYIEPFVWLQPRWETDEARSDTVTVTLYIENLGNMIARSGQFIMYPNWPCISMEIEGGGLATFAVPGFPDEGGICKELGDLSPGSPAPVTLRMTFDSPTALFRFGYRAEWTRVWAVPVLPPAKRFYEDPSFPVEYVVRSSDTRRQDRIMMITCVSSKQLNRHLAIARLRARVRRTLRESFSDREFDRVVRRCKEWTLRKTRAEVRRYVRKPPCAPEKDANDSSRPNPPLQSPSGTDRPERN